jgi:hypothetical protein
VNAEGLKVGDRVRLRGPPPELAPEGKVVKDDPLKDGVLVMHDDGTGPLGWGYSEVVLVQRAVPLCTLPWSGWPLGAPGGVENES